MAGRNANIITVGIRPAWDVLCQVDGLEWGDHKVIDEQSLKPAGKAMNVSKALASIGYPSIATGLWGQEDYEQMVELLKPISCFVDIRFAAVRGHTRRNITIHDTNKNRQMHLRIPGSLANKGSLKRLKGQLEGLVNKNDILVFGGSLPEGAYLQDTIEIVNMCKQRGCEVIVDTSGLPLKRIVEERAADLISPNMSELENLLGNRVKNEVSSIVKETRKLLDDVPTILISRGDEGAILVTKSGCWQASAETVGRKVVNTVGCGDYLLAGLIIGFMEKGNYPEAMENAVRLAASHTFGLEEQMEWWEIEQEVGVNIEQIA